MYTFVTGDAVAHSDHIWEEWSAYLSCGDLPETVDRNAAGICCHTCRTIIL